MDLQWFSFSFSGSFLLVFAHLYLYNFLIVTTDVPVIAWMFRNDIPFRSKEISRAYCSFITSSDFRYELGLPILIPSFLHF